MAEFPALPLWTDALIGDTQHLTPAEFGAYLRLLIAAWRSPDCKLNYSDVQLGRIIGDPKNWYRLKVVVMAFWDLGEDGCYRQKRLSDERDFVSRHAVKSSAGGKAKALKNRHRRSAKGLPNACLTLAPTPTPTPKKERKEVPVADATKPTEIEKEIPVNEPPRARLFREGKTVLVCMGVSEKQSGAVIGRWLKTNPDADGVLAALHYAADNNVIEPIGYVTKLLNTGGINGRRYETLTASERAYRLADEARELERQAGIVGQVDIVRSH